MTPGLGKTQYTHQRYVPVYGTPPHATPRMRIGTMPDAMPAPSSDDPSPSRPTVGGRLQPGILVNVALILLAVLALSVIAARQGEDDLGVEVERREAPGGIDALLVHVSGAVASPGVVEARPGDRIEDVITAAGGVLGGADLDAVNLALRVRDEDVVRVPFEGEASTANLVDLNAATQSELEALPGIGPARARAIIDARPLASTDDLEKRDLIPASVWEDIRTLVIVR